jgi:transcriptional regulator with XRE-family HTH domain
MDAVTGLACTNRKSEKLVTHPSDRKGTELCDKFGTMAVPIIELGPTLRGWRDQRTPEEFGLSTEAGRRARGLRREEVAQLSGVSLDYLVQLEQGRATAPSPQVLNALARALRLSEDERAHLFRLAGQPVPGDRQVGDTLPNGVARMIGQLSASPAAVYDVRWNPVSWNNLWTAVVGDPLQRPERERNMAWRYFAGLPTRVIRSSDGQRGYEETIAADLKSTAGRYPGDVRLARLIADLRAVSPRFDELWDTPRAAVYEQEDKILAHPHLGLLHLDCEILTTRRHDLRIVVYTAAAGSETVRALEKLAAS